MRDLHQTRWVLPLPPNLPVLAGGVARVDAWALIGIVPCPACGAGRLLWAEAGNVPGWRVCSSCKRPWMAQPRGTTVEISIPEVDRGRGPELAWSPPEPGEDRAAWARREVGDA